MPEPIAIMRKEFRIIPPQLVGTQQQLCKIDHPAPPAGILVFTVDADHLLLEIVALVIDMVGTPAFILLRIDEPLHLPWRPLAVIEIQGFQDPLD